MKTLPLSFVAIATVLLVPCIGSSQEANSKWTPTIAPRISLEQIAVAKITSTTTGDTQISILLPQWRTETRTRDFPRTKIRTETKTRTIPNPSGTGTIEEAYTEQVPYTEIITESYNVRVPEKSKRIDIPSKQAGLFRASGELITSVETEKLLASPQHVFLLENPRTGFVIDEYHQSVLSKDFLVLGIDPEFLATAKDQSTPPQPAPTPIKSR